MRRAAPNVYTIPTGADFSTTLVRAFLEGALDLPASGLLASDPLALADVTIFVPTQRVAGALVHAFSEAAGGPAILPRIVPLGLLGEIEDRLALETMGARLETVPPAIEPIDRLLALTRLLQRWNSGLTSALIARDREHLRPVGEALAVASSHADALALAGDLAALLDDLGREGIGWDAVRAAMDASEFDAYWQLTTDFLAVVAEWWPRYLAEVGRIEPTEREVRLIRAEIARLETTLPGGPVIVAGSTGSRPATAALIACIARLSAGAVVLPGLDLGLDAAGWAEIGLERDAGAAGQAQRAGHPQAALKALLARIGIAREAVTELGHPDLLVQARSRAVSEALRPASTTDLWLQTRPALTDAILPAAFDPVTVIAAHDEHEEAVAIALAMRESLTKPGRTAALVTPDRAIARRVRSELQRWDIAVEDSAGTDLTKSPAGVFALTALEVACGGFRPVPLLSLLAHADLRCRRSRSEVARSAATLEIGALRGAVVGPGLDGVRAALKAAPERITDRHAARPLAALSATDLGAAAVLLDDVAAGLRPLCGLLAADSVPVGPLAAALVDAVEALSCNETGVTLTVRHEGALLVDRLDEIAASREAALAIPPAESAAFMRALLAGTAVQPASPGHPRLKILGLLEARLLPMDRAILAGLNEGSWPPTARTDAFLNRPMRLQLGLDPPEKRLGQTAHDFVMAMGHPEVILTRSLRAEGEPTVPSRFLQRLDAFLGAPLAKRLSERGERWLQVARALDKPAGKIAPAMRPKPTPPVALRPKRLSITAIETLYRDPYAIYARQVLKLDPLEDLDPVLGARDRGDLIHEALATFARSHEPPTLERLLASGRTAFEPHWGEPDVRAFWWPRFVRRAEMIVGDAAKRRETLRETLVEADGRHEITLTDGSRFLLTGRADRIDRLADGTFSVTDYKTGEPPGVKEVRRGLAPQLTLTAAMARAAAFGTALKGAAPSELRYLRVFGSASAQFERVIRPEGETLPDLVDRHELTLHKALNEFLRPGTGYLSRKIPKKTAFAGDYDHLARVLEWSAVAGLDDAEDETP